MAKAPNLFGPSDVFGGGGAASTDDLFASPKVAAPQTGGASTSIAQRVITRATTAKAPTQKELEARAQAERDTQVSNVRQQLTQMQQSPEWAEASLDKRRDLYDKWKSQKWDPMLRAIEDPNLADALSTLPGETLNADIKNLERSISDASRLDDTWKGVKATALQTAQGLGDYAPAAVDQYRIENLRSTLAQDGKPLVLGGVPQMKFDGTPVIQQFTPEQRAEVEAQIAELTTTRNAQMKEAAATQKDIDAVRDSQSIGQIDRDRELKEDVDNRGGLVGTLANAAAHPSNVLQLAAEQLPNAIPAIAASIVGGLTAGPTGAVAGARISTAALSAQDAMSSAIQQVQQMPDDKLQALPEFQSLRLQNPGMTTAQVKEELALRAGFDAAGLGAVVGTVTGGFGSESGLGRSVASMITRDAAPEAVQPFVRAAARQLPNSARKLGAAARQLPNFARELGVEGVEEGATQLAANVAQNRQTGSNVDIWNDVGQSAAQGIIAAGPLSGTTVVQEVRRATRPGPTTEATPGGIDAEGTITVPGAREAYAAQQQTTGQEAPAESVAADTNPATTALNELRPAFQDIASRNGTTFDVAEANNFIDTLLDAEANGAPSSIIEASLTNVQRAVPPGLGYSSILDGYRQRRAAREQSAATELADTIVNNEAPTDGTGTTESVTGTDNASPATVADINSAMETAATSSEPAASTVSEIVESVSPAAEDAGTSRAEGDANTANDSVAPAAEAVGASPAVEPAVSGPDNQSVPNAGETVSAGERSDAGQPGQSAADGRGTDSTADGTQGSNPRVGDTVTYTPPFRGAKPMEGQVTRVNPDGTFSMAVRGPTSTTTYANLPTTNIQGNTTAAQSAATVAATEPAPAAEPAPAPAAEPAPVVHGQEELGVASEPSSADVAAVSESAGNLTPSGYNVDNLTSRADRLAESDSAHAFAGLELSQALEDGNHAKADEIAQYLYEQGLRQFRPPQESTGRAARTIDDVFLNTLEPAERLALQREYANVSDTLPPETDSFGAFRDTAIQDQLLVDSGQAPVSGVLDRMTEIGRNIIRKMARALAIVVAAITINQMTPINDAVAAAGQGYVQNVQQVQGLSRAASTVNSWVQESRDNAGKPYIIADKQSGEIHVVDGKGRVVATAPALYGRKTGDGMTLGETPAGIFSVHQEAAPASYGGDLQQFATAPNGDVYAIHRVLTNNPKQNRLGRLASPAAEDNRVSLGCINIPADIYNKYLGKSFDGKLYVLPDQRSLGDTFKGLDEQRAKDNLAQGQQMPENFTAPTAPEYQSSTVTQAPTDFHETGPEVVDTGASITAAAQDGDLSTAMAFTAAQDNDASTGQIVAQAGMPFLIFGRNQRRAARARRRGQSPDETQPDDSTPPSVADKDYHSVDAVLGKQPDRVADQAAQNASWLGDLTGKAAQKLSDTHHAFISWMGTTGLIPTNGEFDAHQAIYSLKSQTNRMRQRNEALTQKYMVPIFNHIVSVAQRMGRIPDQVGLEMGSWQTFRHIPEANRALRQNLESDLNTVLLTGTDEEVQTARDMLTALDQVQAGLRDIAELKRLGVGGLAGGLTDAQAQAGIQKVEAMQYRPEDLAEFRRLIRRAVDGLVEERTKPVVTPDGRVLPPTLLPEEVAKWQAYGFVDYVPMYVNHERQDAGNDVYLGTSNFNPAGDYTRNGSVTRASHAMITIQQMLYRTAAGIESAPFKEDLHRMYVESRPAGLGRVNLADARMNPRSEVFNKKLHEKRGFVYTVRGLDESGEPTSTRYKYYFDDDAISEGIFANHAEPDWKVAKLLGNATAGFGRMLTKYNPLFPVKTWWRDAGERRRTLAARKITDSDGNVIPLRRLYTGMMASLYNPVHVVNLGAYLMTGSRAGTPTVRAYQELQRLGGVSTYQHALAKSVTDMRSTLKSMTGLRKHAKSLDRFFTHWNEMWAAAPAVAGYMALRGMNVPAEQASFRSLDVMNASNKGEWHGALSLFYPFIAPTFEGGRNLLRSIRTRRGQAIFAANVASSIALYSMLFGLAQSMAGDDDDQGNLLDNMSMDDLSMNIPLIIGKDDIIKIPVAFGMSRISWMIGAGLHRMSRGVDTPGKVASTTTLALLRELQPIELETKVMSDNIMAGLTLSAAPAAMSPMLEVAMNTNHFGGMIHSKAAREGFASDAAMSSTPQVWTDVAKSLRKYTGVDTYPENIRHLSQAWLVGPMRGVGTAMEKSSLYTTGGKLTSRQEIGPVWDAVGVAQFWDNGSRSVSRTYWKYQDKADDVLRKYGQMRTKEGTKPGQAAEAARRRVLVAGGSPQEALLVEYAILADKEREKSNRELKGRVKDYKAKDLDLETLSPVYEAHANKEERMMRNFIRNARGVE